MALLPLIDIALHFIIYLFIIIIIIIRILHPRYMLFLSVRFSCKET